MRPVDCNSFEVKGLFYVFGRLLELRQRKRQGTILCLVFRPGRLRIIGILHPFQYTGIFIITIIRGFAKGICGSVGGLGRVKTLPYGGDNRTAPLSPNPGQHILVPRSLFTEVYRLEDKTTIQMIFRKELIHFLID